MDSKLDRFDTFLRSRFVRGSKTLKLIHAEIVIRSPHLLIGIEKSLSETESESGKAMIFASISVQETG